MQLYRIIFLYNSNSLFSTYLTWQVRCQFKFHMIYVIEDSGTLVKEKGEETPLRARNFALVNPERLMSGSDDAISLFMAINCWNMYPMPLND